MKNLLLVLIAGFIGLQVVVAQETFEGKLTMSINVSGEGADAMAAFMPTGYEFIVSEHGMIMKVQGNSMISMMMGKVMVNKDGSYMIKDTEQTVYRMPEEMEEEVEAPEPTITKLDETIEMHGYTCQKYKIEAEVEGETTTQYIWVAKNFEFPTFGKGTAGDMTNVLGMYGELKGFPMKTEVNQQGMIITTEVTDLDAYAPEKNLFKLPKGYKVEDFDTSSMFGN